MGILPARRHDTFESAVLRASMNNPEQEVNFFLVEAAGEPVAVGFHSAWNYFKRHPEYTLISELATGTPDAVIPGEVQVHASASTYNSSIVLPA